ncbi:hypothetical protein DCAR_0206504 [Daucus carota subsp. sativus]|uniref:Leucine-rich repeat-containing N-terminal plant-type domain-containing protein n=1 Tax=Daucus carota subsp. sativus TaxID=79200 RepID=A0AAF0WEG6_DAUCS|nr:hypothetical protein DCAR_0206504 [Daucus carota subsp. sativus]
MLESLDLSSNRLEGEIPQQITNIYSLSRLNLSCNQLSGHIPQGYQFNTFENDSYVGNLGLCGNPLSRECEHDTGFRIYISRVQIQAIFFCHPL